MAELQTIKLVVEGMSCQHCVASINDHLSSFPGVEKVDIALETGKVSVSGSGIAAPFIIREIDALGFSARLDA